MDNKKIVKVKTIYEGLFVFHDEYGEGFWTQEETPYGKCSLENAVAYPHITICFKPDTPHKNFYGQRFYAVVKGYGCDGKNEGYVVDIILNGIYGDSNNNVRSGDELAILLSNVRKPHITSSVSIDGVPKDTVNLDFTYLPLEEKEIVLCEFGAFVEIEYENGSKTTRFIFLPNEV